MNSGIYKIVNLINNKMYVGRASFIDKRKNEHFRLLKLNKHKNSYLQLSYNKYGKENFIFEVIEYCEKEKLISKEDYWCKKLNVNDPKIGYNLAITHDSIGFYKHSDETKKKMSNSSKGKKKSKEAVEKMRISLKGRKFSEDHIRKIKDWYSKNPHPMIKGHSQESKKKMSNSRKGKISNNKRKIFSIFEGEILYFNSITEASIYYKIGVTSICNNLKGKSKKVRLENNKIEFKYED